LRVFRVAEIDDLEKRAYLQRVAEIPVPPSVAAERRKQDEDVRVRLEVLEHVISFDPFDVGAAHHAFAALVFAISSGKGIV
jgi:hypothetical protein